MRYFFDEQGRTRVSARGVLKVRRGLKPAENTAHRENNHLNAKLLVAGNVRVCAVIVDGFKIFGTDRKPGNIVIFF